jgi:hypothetical protein
MYPMSLRAFLVIVLFGAATSLQAAEARIVKVLPHLLDSKGRNALAPSLFERDAYQAHLRDFPEKVSALRFDVQYKAGGRDPLVLRIEVRGSKMAVNHSRIFETDVKPHRFFSSWGALHLDKKTYDEIGNIVAWRATLWRDGEQIAEQLSFLW